ncbi:hypothetical protein CTI14_29775 [Methylobacterium radiotolerans]|nr:hypothetical protein CTI14_29775 [Methylobacterium radiotolerans]
MRQIWGIATEVEKAALASWRAYRIEVSRVDFAMQNPAWPALPNERGLA